MTSMSEPPPVCTVDGQSDSTLRGGSDDASPAGRGAEDFLVDDDGFVQGAGEDDGGGFGYGGDGFANGGDDGSDDGEGGHTGGGPDSDLAQWLTSQQASLSAGAHMQQPGGRGRNGAAGATSGGGFWRFSAARSRPGTEAVAAKKAPVKRGKK